MGTAIDLTGQKLHRLTFLKRTGAGGRWLVRCDCGTEKEVLAPNVKKGLTKSCGLHVEANLRVIPARENWRKRNHFEGEW